MSASIAPIMEYTIRAITDEDVEGYHSCLDIVARERRFLAFTEAPPLEQSRAFVLNQIACGAPMYIASTASQVIGWCDISPLSRPSLSHRGELGMGVHPTHRKKGVGHRLLESALAGACAYGLKQVELAVLSMNTPAIALYHSMGFETVGTIPRAQRMDEGYEDDLLMVLLLTDRHLPVRTMTQIVRLML